jgi:hypothetical protein
VIVRELVGQSSGLLLPTSGVVAPKAGLTLSTSWEGCSVRPGCIASAPYVGWQLYFDDELVEKIRAAGEALGETITYPDSGDYEALKARYLHLSRIVGEHETAWMDSIDRRLRELEQVHHSGQVTDAEFESWKARICSEI